MRVLRGLAIPLLALAAALGSAAPAGASAAGRPPLHSCDLGLPRPLRCGHITAPMRRAEPALGATRVAFAVRTRADRRQPSLGTIVAMDGGPGYASTAAPYARSLVAALAPLLRRRDLVLFDERGTGLSDVVDCPALQNGLIQEGIAVGECANRLGPRYAGYTTAEAAADLDAVRRALGLGRVFFYGDSYGTLFGQAYAARYPGSLRGLILDSAYPADDPYYRTLLPAGLDGLRIACRDSPGCAGDPVARLTRVVRRFHAAGRSTEGLIGFLLEAGTLAPRSYLSLDDGDRRFLAGEPRRLDRLLAPGPAGHGKLSEFSYGLEIAVTCNDYPLLWDPYAADRRTDPPALGRGDEDAEGLLRPLRSPRVPALRRRPPDRLPDLAGAATGWAGAAGALRLARPDLVSDPDPRRPGRRRHLGRRGPPGEAPLPALTPLRGAGPRPRLEPLLPVQLAGGGRDPALPRV